MPADHAFLDELRKGWGRNFAATILYARLNYDRIPPGVVGVAERMNQSFRAQQDVDNTVKVMLGNMGVGAGPGRASMDPDAFMFHAALAQIVAHRGDPPATAQLQAQSEAILAGRLDPLLAFELSMIGNAEFAGAWRLIVSMAPDFVPILQNMGRFMAALAVPRHSIPRLLGMTPPPVPRPPPLPTQRRAPHAAPP